MSITELKLAVKSIRADEKKRKRIDALLAEARAARQRLALTPPRRDDLGDVKVIPAEMTDREFETCVFYHSKLLHCFDCAIALREGIERTSGLDKMQHQQSLEDFRDKCWATIDGPCRNDVPAVYFQIMLPHVHALMKALKQQKKIKPTKKSRR